jgi:hypothetical protein
MPVEPPSDASLERPIRIPPTVLFRELQGETVLLNLSTGAYFSLDPVATVIWRRLRDHGRPSAVVPDLLAEFDVDEAQARRDLARLLDDLRTHGLVEPVPAP